MAAGMADEWHEAVRHDYCSCRQMHRVIAIYTVRVFDDRKEHPFRYLREFCMMSCIISGNRISAEEKDRNIDQKKYVCCYGLAIYIHFEVLVVLSPYKARFISSRMLSISSGLWLGPTIEGSV